MDRKQFSIDPAINKSDAILFLADRAGFGPVDAWSFGVRSVVERLVAHYEPAYNSDIVFAESVNVAGVEETVHFEAFSRDVAAPIHASGTPRDMPSASNPVHIHSPEFRTLSIRGGYICSIADIMFSVASDGHTAISDYSGRFSNLIRFYDVDVSMLVRSAPYIDGTVVSIADDVRPLNYCHWMLDWITRLAFLGSRARDDDVYVVTTPLTSRFQIESLRMCGFDESRIIPVEPFAVVQARELIVPNDLAIPAHPAFHVAPWALTYLRSTVGMEPIPNSRSGTSGRKIYLSRHDAPGRRIVNEDAFTSFLASLGYQRVLLGGAALADQVAALTSASHVVSLHGAGLTNFVFAPNSATLIEIFSSTYTGLEYYALAAGKKSKYITYRADNVVSQSRSQVDDVIIDIPHFAEKCAEYL